VAPRCDTVVVIGLGLIGGSLARALREAHFCRHLAGWGHREGSLQRGVELGVIDSFTLDLDAALADADLAVLCAPTLSVAQLLERILPRLGDTGLVVTDAASVKGNLRAAAVRACGRVPPRFVPGHPIAGSEHSGVEASAVDLFRGHRVILTPEEDCAGDALALVRAMWEATGAEVVEMSVPVHDAVLAATSHLPHMLAYALVDALASGEHSEEVFRCAAGGFRDFTRIASSDPVMWRDIAIANRDALLAAIDTFGEHLERLRAAVADSDAVALEETFARAKSARDGFAQALAQRGTGDAVVGE